MYMQQTNQQDKVKVTLNKLVEYFSKPANDVPKYIAETYLQSLNIPSDKWSLNNKFIALVCGGSVDARTYLQWSQVSRNVKKGQKAFYILAPNSFTVEKENEKTGELEKRKVLAGFKGIAVFAANQTEGKEIVYVEEPKQKPPLYDVAVKFGLKVKYDKTIRGEHGSYNQCTDEIRLCTKDIGVFFHELAHAVHKKIDGKLKGGQDAEQETIAEFTSCVIAAMYGYDKKSNAYHYIRSYSTDKDKTGAQVVKVLGKVQKILDYIFAQE